MTEPTDNIAPSDAQERVLAYLSRWERLNYDQVAQGNYHLHGLSSGEGTGILVLDWRDVMLLCAVAAGENAPLTAEERRQGRIRSSAGRSAYMELAVQAVEGYRKANSRQIETIGRLVQKLHNIKKILRDRKEDKNITEARHTKAMIERAIDE